MASQDFWQETVTVYLIHFDRPYRHARHYIGSATNLGWRIHEHQTGNGSALMAAVARAGIGWRIARTWENIPRWHEAKFHRQKNNPKLCPFCKGHKKE